MYNVGSGQLAAVWLLLQVYHAGIVLATSIFLHIRSLGLCPHTPRSFPTDRAKLPSSLHMVNLHVILAGFCGGSSEGLEILITQTAAFLWCVLVCTSWLLARPGQSECRVHGLVVLQIRHAIKLTRQWHIACVGPN